MLERELEAIGKLEALYERVAEFVEPSHLEENPLPTVRTYLATLRSLERCIGLRAKLVREAGRLPRPEPEQPMATVDLSRLSDGALREVEQAMVPLGTPPAAVSEADGERDDRIGSCKENNENDKITPAAAAPQPGRETARIPEVPRKAVSPEEKNFPPNETAEVPQPGKIASPATNLPAPKAEESLPKRAKTIPPAAGKPSGTAIPVKVRKRSRDPSSG